MNISKEEIESIMDSIGNPEKCTAAPANKLYRMSHSEPIIDNQWDRKIFLGNLASFIDLQNRKPARHRPSIAECIERVVNADKYIMAAGALSVEHSIQIV